MNREADNFDSTDNDVASVVSGLGTVKAPAGFERQVMTRIAAGAPARRFDIPLFAYAIPALIVLLVATFLIFRSEPAATGQPETVAQAPAAVPQEQGNSVSAIPAPAANALLQQPEVVQQTPPQAAPPNQQLQKGNTPTVASANNNSARVITFGQGQAKTPMPEGISPKPQRRTPDANSIISQLPVPVVDILEMLGMTVKYENEWKVTALSPNGAAHRSGVVTGDVITAINERALTSDTAFHGSGTFTSITVRRGSQNVVIKLK